MTSSRDTRAIAMAAVMLLAACTSDTGAEGPEMIFSEVSLAESPIAFDHPDLSGGFSQFFHGFHREYGGDASLGMWAADDGYPRAELAFIEYPPGSFFTGGTLSSVTGGWEALHGSRPAGTVVEIANAYGVVAMQPLAVDGRPCVAFMQRFGVSRTGIGTRTLSGYFCAGEHDVLNRPALQRIATGIVLHDK